MSGDRAPARRFPASVFDRGTEPDARFSLANERTFLAWIRTGLALLAGGVALEALGLGIQPACQTAASLLLVAAGLITPVQGWFGWALTERALRLGTPLPSAGLALPLAIIVGVAGALILIGILL